MADDVRILLHSHHRMTSVLIDGLAIITPPANDTNYMQRQWRSACSYITINQVTWKTNITVWKCVLKGSYCVLWAQIMRGLQSLFTKGLRDKSWDSTKWVFSKSTLFSNSPCEILYIFPFVNISLTGSELSKSCPDAKPGQWSSLEGSLLSGEQPQPIWRVDRIQTSRNKNTDVTSCIYWARLSPRSPRQVCGSWFLLLF